MLHPFVSNEAVRLGRSGASGLTASVVAHAAVVAAALVATADSGIVAAARPRAMAERIVYVTRDLVKRAAPSPTRRKAERRPDEPTEPTEPEVERLELPTPVDMALPALNIDLPSVDLAAVASRSGDFAALGGRQILRSSQNLGVARYSGDSVYTESNVEQTATEREGNPVPSYPYTLQAKGVEDRFIVRFVVDTAGHVREETLRFPTTVHRYFVASVRAALLRSTYYPAEVGGRRVAQLVQQQFTFVIHQR